MTPTVVQMSGRGLGLGPTGRYLSTITIKDEHSFFPGFVFLVKSSIKQFAFLQEIETETDNFHSYFFVVLGCR